MDDFDDWGCWSCEELRSELEDQRVESDGARRALVAYATKLEEERDDLRLMLAAMVDIIDNYVDGLAEEDMIALEEARELSHDPQDG